MKTILAQALHVITCISVSIAVGGCTQAIGVVKSINGPTTANAIQSYRPGTPAVVFEHGADEDGKATWNELIKQVGAIAPTYAFSRTGWGEEIFGEVPPVRLPSKAAHTLRQNLQKAGANPPYILVAHSIGSYYVLNFAQQWPDEVASIILIDGRMKNFTALCKQYEGNLCDPTDNLLLLAMMPAAGRAEVLGEKNGRNEVPDAKQLAQIPVTLLYNNQKEFPHSDGFIRAWIQSQQDFSAGLINGESIAVPGGHFIHHTHPKLVLDVINKHINAVRDTQ
ncbi:alpha/beta fold hydrolase [Chitinibacter sp. ZOR0017]|uniref:alpha/beta fold hydrolase n=1 Tax=Chitinibacter sp. ZOR0017 TaxID=1339254 RepID=UPI0018CCB8B0|nr:alpha/beta hydrolase [Chitinibacter sp. ZOR0017]